MPPTLYNEPGTVCWNELMTWEWERAKEFYSGLFGWDAELMEGTEGPYVSCKIDGEWAGGIMQMGSGRD
jgi:hypothetical protein